MVARDRDRSLTFRASAIDWDCSFLHDRAGLRPVDPPPDSIAEWIEGRRIMPTSTPFPGFWENARTPYWVELMDDMSPSSPIHHEVVMKAAQIGASATAENIIAFYIGADPSEILYISATEPLLKKWGPKRLEPLINSCRLRDLISSQTDNPKSRRSGDLILSKEFVGGALDMASAQSASSLRSDSKRRVIRDEIDGAPAELTTGEGNFLAVSEARTAAWGDRAKILDISTPTIDGRSLIQSQFELGDKRYFFVPCPLCGKFQMLKWGNDRSQYGIKAETKAGELVRAYYLCDHCHDAFFNHHKTDMLARGRWEPSSKSTAPNFRSRQLSGIYRPVGMTTWTAMWRKYEIAKDNPEKMRGFVNLELGLPYKETGSRPKLQHIIELRGGYREGTIPDGVLFLTAGIDVQRGSAKDPANPPRLEMEVCGHGAGFRTWSIIYRRFEGAVDDPSDGAWLELDDFARAGKLTFTRDDGTQFPVVLTFIDSGDGMTTDTVYSFCERWDYTYPTKGFSALKQRKGEAEDPMVPGQFFKRYRAAAVGGITLYEISTVFYKNHIYNNLKIKRQDTGEQRPGFCAFPVDYDEKYFNMLRSEDKLSDGSYNSYGRRNESLDCRVMNLCACDVFLEAKIKEQQQYYRELGHDKFFIKQINHNFVLELLKKTTARQIG
jgi:phage terminase large subunit GpA-like protein